MRKSKWIKILTSIGVVFFIVFVVIPPFTRKWYRNHSTKYAPPVPTSKWEKFSSVEGNFSIWFPGIPKSTNFTEINSWSNDEKSVEISTDLHEFYVSPNVQNIFAVAYCDHPMFAKMSKSSNPQTLLEKSESLLVSKAKGKIVFEQESEFAGWPAREFEYVAGGKANYSVRVKYILVDMRIYQVMVFFLTANPRPEERTTFFDSFKILTK